MFVLDAGNVTRTGYVGNIIPLSKSRPRSMKITASVKVVLRRAWPLRWPGVLPAPKLLLVMLSLRLLSLVELRGPQ